ncbi:hypothetical protein NQ176_g10168 [Zarea fungicola]|uniref:Uncharacterized protein n=1 Tax=Zarea fungicola TaxID=93591 RepID=A0ACC1MJF7_9HYPO|nr:hypothetical protein NQ176_g10168 [Lecanicillium fungicola]
MKIAAIFLSAFCAAALGIPLDGHVQHEKRSASQGLVKTRHVVDRDAKIDVRIALKQRNLERGMELLMAVSDPESSTYGQHYSADEVAEIFAPDQSSIDKVTKWLRDAGIDGITQPKSKGFLDFQATTDKLESLLQTKYHIYDHPASGNQHMGTDEYHLPTDISQVVDFVAPGVVTANVQKRSAKVAKPGRPARVQFLGNSFATAGCDTQITPTCIKQIYKIPDGTLKDPSNALGIYESDDEMHKQSDLDLFYSRFATNIPKGFGPKIDLIDWNGQKPDPSQAQGEAALDFDIAVPLIYPQGTELYQSKDLFDGNQRLGIFNQWLDAIDGSYCTASSHGETGDDPVVDGTTRNEMCATWSASATSS